MSATRTLLLLAGLGAAAACAGIQPPPGGPPDKAAPVLVRITPDSGASLPGFRGQVLFEFNEVVTEGSTPNFGRGTGDLEKLIILSPTTRVPRVDWQRTRIGVRPAEGWLPGRTYRVQLLPGVVDVRSNRSTSSGIVTFTTGGPAPTAVLTGRLLDWTTGRPVANGLVIAELLPQRLPYLLFADSAGAVRAGPLPAGAYRVIGVVDANRNNKVDPRELVDTVQVDSGTTVIPPLYAFPHDTNGPRLSQVTARDTITATLTFSQVLAQDQQYDSLSIRLRRLPDSTLQDTTPVAVTRVVQAWMTDTTKKLKEGERPMLTKELVVTAAAKLPPGTRYLVEAAGIRNANRVAADSRQTLVIQAAPPPRKPSPADSARAKQDTVRTRPDTTRMGADTLRAPAPRRP